MNDKLLPCPFCGSTEIRPAERGLAYAECHKCDAYGPSHIEGFDSDSWRSANDMWNQRATAQPKYREPTLEDVQELNRTYGYAFYPMHMLECLKQLNFVRKVQP